MFAIGARGPIQPEEIYALKDGLSSRPVTERFEEHWQIELQKASPSIFRVVMKEYGCLILFWGLSFSFTETLFR